MVKMDSLTKTRHTSHAFGVQSHMRYIPCDNSIMGIETRACVSGVRSASVDLRLKTCSFCKMEFPPFVFNTADEVCGSICLVARVVARFGFRSQGLSVEL